MFMMIASYPQDTTLTPFYQPSYHTYHDVFILGGKTTSPGATKGTRHDDSGRYVSRSYLASPVLLPMVGPGLSCVVSSICLDPAANTHGQIVRTGAFWVMADGSDDQRKCISIGEYHIETTTMSTFSFMAADHTRCQ